MPANPAQPGCTVRWPPSFAAKAAPTGDDTDGWGCLPVGAGLPANGAATRTRCVTDPVRGQARSYRGCPRGRGNEPGWPRSRRLPFRLRMLIDLQVVLQRLQHFQHLQGLLAQFADQGGQVVHAAAGAGGGEQLAADFVQFAVGLFQVAVAVDAFEHAAGVVVPQAELAGGVVHFRHAAQVFGCPVGAGGVQEQGRVDEGLAPLQVVELRHVQQADGHGGQGFEALDIDDEVLQGQRPADPEALAGLAAVFLQHPVGVFVLDAFGHHVHVELVGHADAGLQDFAVLGGPVQVADEFLVDLEYGEGPLAELDQAGMAGAEIVHGDRDAQVGQVGELSLGAVGVDEDGLGDFDLQLVGADLAAFDGAADDARQLVVVEVLAGGVERDRQVRLHGADDRQVDQQPAEHEAGDPADEVAFLGQRNERRRRHQAAARPVPAQQGFRAAQFAGDHRDLGLVMQLELAARQGLFQVLQADVMCHCYCLASFPCCLSDTSSLCLSVLSSFAGATLKGFDRFSCVIRYAPTDSFPLLLTV